MYIINLVKYNNNIKKKYNSYVISFTASYNTQSKFKTADACYKHACCKSHKREEQTCDYTTKQETLTFVLNIFSYIYYLCFNVLLPFA